MNDPYIVGDVFEECWLEIESLGKICQALCPRPKGPLKSANEVSLPLENKLKELQQDIKELSKKVSELKGTFPSTKENKVPEEFWKNIRWISRDQTWNQFGEVRSSK
ncbi:hypothetical protein L484_015652 [Morus notabilis]|uniref:Uncharacterized protein n=1 Tax=Morus notabilis TaxID=981085 RepID=W9R6B3_9ROSA|nr:hypothetical protein L484_015652 [Morus notabilis]